MFEGHLQSNTMSGPCTVTRLGLHQVHTPQVPQTLWLKRHDIATVWAWGNQFYLWSRQVRTPLVLFLTPLTSRLPRLQALKPFAGFGGCLAFRRSCHVHYFCYGFGVVLLSGKITLFWHMQLQQRAGFLKRACGFIVWNHGIVICTRWAF